MLSVGLPLLLLHCAPGRLASGLSAGPEASGSRHAQGGGCGWLHLPGDLLQGAPLWPGSVFMSVFKSAAARRERARREYSTVCPQSAHESGVVECVNLPQGSSNSTTNKYVSVRFVFFFFFGKLLRPLLY